MFAPAFTSSSPVHLNRARTHVWSQASSLRPGVPKSPCPRASRPATTPRMQTWSDPAVTREYIDFLMGNNNREDTVDCQSTIVGSGRIGSFLAEHGMNDLVLKRGQAIPADAPGPVYVCTRNDDLQEIIENCPEEKKEDLVFVQNGMLERVLRNLGVGDNTRANLYFAVPKVGDVPIDGTTELNPEGLTTVCGKWEGAFAQRLERCELTCTILKERDFRRTQMEKLVWITVFNLIGSVHGNITMGEIVRFHEKEVREMVLEMSGMIRFTLTCGMLPKVDQKLLSYSQRVKDFPTALKEWKWRNGFFYDYSQLAIGNGLPDPTPMHTGYLEDGKKMGVISW